MAIYLNMFFNFWESQFWNWRPETEGGLVIPTQHWLLPALDSSHVLKAGIDKDKTYVCPWFMALKIKELVLTLDWRLLKIIELVLTLHWGSLKIKELTNLFGSLPVLSWTRTRTRGSVILKNFKNPELKVLWFLIVKNPEHNSSQNQKNCPTVVSRSVQVSLLLWRTSDSSSKK
jgi:hypothetical protein